METEDLKTDHDELKKRGSELFAEAKGSWEVLRERWLKDNDLYDGKFSKEESEYSQLLGVRRLFIRKTWAQTQRILTDCMDAIYFDPDELVKLTPNKAIPAQSQAIFKSVLNHRLRGNPINYYEETQEAFLDAIKNKYCIIKVYPRFIIEKTPKKTVLAENITEKVAEEYDEKVTYFCPAWDTVPYEDMFFSPRATWKDYWKYPMIHRKKISRAEAREKGYINVDNVQSSYAETDEVKQQRQEKDGSPFNEQATNKATDGFYIYEIWDFKMKDGRMESGSFIMGGGPGAPDVVCRGWEWNTLPYRKDQIDPVRPPFSVGVALPRAHALPGDSFPEVTEGLQMETNASVNQEREAVALALRPPLLVNKDSGVDLYGLMVRKIGAVLQTEVPVDQTAMELSTKNPIPVSAPNRQRIDTDYAEISSITPMMMGAARGADMPATNYSGLQANSNKAIQRIFRNVYVTGILPALWMLMRLEQEYETDAHIEEVTGEVLGFRFEKDINGVYVGASPKSVIQGRYAFEIESGVSKQSQLGQWKTIIELINQANATGAQLVQMGVAAPQQVQFYSPNIAIEQMMRAMGQKNIDEMKIQAIQPPVEQGEGAGFASQPSISGMVTPAQEAMLAG